ncbi:MAG TPA: hypothetical protein VG188_12980, partial [Solirubrobacteraceae bacterium]|nr:hypothetical protein [Solirubrobacteraceae bacterium]
MPRGLRRRGLQGLQSSEDDFHRVTGSNGAGQHGHDAGDDLDEIAAVRFVPSSRIAARLLQLAPGERPDGPHG